MIIFSGSNVGSVDIADKFESLSYKWQIVSSCIVLWFCREYFWFNPLVIRFFSAYYFVLVTLVFKLDVVNIFIPVERELQHCV